MDMIREHTERDLVGELPRLYELHTCEAVDDMLTATVDYAAEGADEGTLLWAHSQSAGRGRLDRPWLSPPGALHCGLVLRPEVDLANALESLLVAQVALGGAIAEQVSPMTELRYRWPNDILLSRAKVGGLNLAVGPLRPASDTGEGIPEWLALAIQVNVRAAPAELGFAAASLRTDGDSEGDAADLLVAFARQFLSWINRWAEEGLTPVRRAWLQRPAGIDETCRFELPGGALDATFVDLGPQGEAIVTLSDGTSRALSLGEYFGLA
ncbi:MAG TPA: biotin--[acetyl-CoA-carboxylase] ligase [Gammaproteobacteria bacterium]|nr:biotin--[acetyl-CoA-carboxylase] ligase [Gammaproteobacteria bacterium]